MIEATIVDISEGGIRVESTETFPVKSTLNVFVHFPDGIVHARARVVRILEKPRTIALAFIEKSGGFSTAYGSWLAEAPPTEAASAATGTPDPATASAPGPVTTAPTGPQGASVRRFDTPRGKNYEATIECSGNVWSLNIYPSPRDPQAARPEFSGDFPDYASAERACREFLRDH